MQDKAESDSGNKDMQGIATDLCKRPVVRRLGCFLLLALVCAGLPLIWTLVTRPDKPPPIIEPNATQLTDGRTVDAYPRWSPDGQWIAFQRAKKDSHPGDIDESTSEIFVVNVDSREELQVTHTPGINAGASHPTWAPEGHRIAYVEKDFATRSTTLFIINMDGSGLIKLLDCHRSCESPDWDIHNSTILR